MKRRLAVLFAIPLLGASLLFAATKITGALIVNSTLLSPVVNGTPSGTGIRTTVMKAGTQGGNYGTTNAGLVAVDGTNLSYTVTVPSGWALLCQASGSAQVASGGANAALALQDSVNGVIQEELITSTTAIASGGGLASSMTNSFSLTAKIAGDGMSHTVQLMYGGVTPAYSELIINISTAYPTMLFSLVPSN
jgi:hypothetical protein